MHRLRKKAGRVVFIDTDFDVCYERIKNDPHRPIAYNSTKQQLKERYDQRRPVTLEGDLSAVQMAKLIKDTALGK